VPLSCNLGTLTSWNPLGHSRPVTGLLYLYLLKDRLVSIATRLRTGRTGIRIPIEKKIFSSQRRPGQGWLWAPSNLHFQWVLVLLPGVNRMVGDYDHSPPSTAEVETDVSVAIPLLPLRAFLACTGLYIVNVCDSFALTIYVRPTVTYVTLSPRLFFSVFI